MGKDEMEKTVKEGIKMNEKAEEQLKKKFNKILKQFKETDEEIQKVRHEFYEKGEGCLGYLKHRPDLKYANIFQSIACRAIASLYLIISGKEDDKGKCGKWCIGCDALRRDENGKWYCQEECECK